MSTDNKCVYLKIADDFKNKIELGLLRENERLSSCRELALKLGINPNTVQRAYSILEQDGYIYTIPKKGIYVSSSDKTHLRETAAKEKLKEIKAAGISREKLSELIDEIYGENYDNDKQSF